MPLTFVLLAGEASGDTQGAVLVEEIRRREPQARFLGVGGPRMAAAGVEILYDSTHWGAIGVAEGLKLVIPLGWRKAALIRRLRRSRPDLLIPIDFGFFNVRVAHPLRAAGVPVLYYFPPRSWSQKGYVSTALRESVDGVATPFPWSARAFRDVGVPASFVGHPLLDAAQRLPAADVLRAEWELEPAGPVIALLPGSRKQEVHNLWPQLVEAALQIQERIPAAQFLVPVAATVDRPWLQSTAQQVIRRWKLAKQAAPRDGADTRSTAGRAPAEDEAPLAPLCLRLVPGRTLEVLSVADAAATCSGTATLEASILQVPMAILYGGTGLMAIEWKLRNLSAHGQFIGMPNLVAGRGIVRELIGKEAVAELIAAETLDLLSNQERARQMRADLAAVTRRLGTSGAAGRTASIAVAMARGEWTPVLFEQFSLPLEELPTVPSSGDPPADTRSLPPIPPQETPPREDPPLQIPQAGFGESGAPAGPTFTQRGGM